MMSGYESLESPVSVSKGDTNQSRLVGRGEDRSGPRVVFLILGFIGAFALAWLAVVAAFFSFKDISPKRAEAPSESASVAAFADAVAIDSSGAALSVVHHPLLNPTGGDFMLIVWFKLREGLGPQERATFLGKYGPGGENAEGYALALVGGADGVRPNVFWQKGKGKGRWFAFASTQIELDKWYVMGVTFRAQRYLGVHIAPHASDAQPEVLGGYDLGGSIVPDSSAPLSVGGFRGSKFRGFVGPFGVLRDIDISKDAASLVKQLARDPSKGMSVVDESQVALWATPTKDIGPLRLAVSEVANEDR